MKVAFPHMGNLWVGLKAVCEELRIDYVIPPLSSRRTLSLAVRYSPEGLCLPFKITLGNFIEALEMGADTLLQAGGTGICRLGRYALVQQNILRDMGYKFEMITLGVSEKKLQGLIQIFKRLTGNTPLRKIISAIRFGIAKQSAIDELERMVLKIRAVELEKGKTTSIFREAIKEIDKAGDYAQLNKVKEEYRKRLEGIEIDREGNPPVVGVMGEFYVVLDPFSNMDVEIELGKLGVEVRRSLFISEWTKFSFFLNPLGINEKAKLQRAAKPYLSRDVGGDGWESVGEKVLHAKHYDGLIHLAPFTCMPETIAQNILPSIKEDIPVLTILCDEQMGRAGLLTRLEAFVDLIKRRRKRYGNLSRH